MLTHTHTHTGEHTRRYSDTTNSGVEPNEDGNEAAEREKVRNRGQSETEKGAYGQIEARKQVKRNLGNGIVNTNEYKKAVQGGVDGISTWGMRNGDRAPR